MSTLLHEIRLALRNLRKSPGTTALAIAVLALGIGGNSAMFSIANSLLFRPFEFSEPERVVSVVDRDTESGRYRGVSYPNYLDLREATTSFEQLAVHTLAMAGLTEGEETRRTFVSLVSANYFDTFGVQPYRGRLLRPAEEASGARVAVLSHGLYERRGRGEDVIGETVRLNGLPYTVVGVAPPGFGGTSVLFSPDLWVPIDSHEALQNDFETDAGRSIHDRGNHSLIVFGRLRDGVDAESANADLERIALALASSDPAENEHHTFAAHPMSRVSVSTSPQTDDEMSMLSALLLSMATVLLLVAGLNLATLQGARGLARRREIAVRFALGGGRLSIIRQLMVESLLLALAAGVLGLGVGWMVPRLLVASIERFSPFQLMLRADPDWRVVAATLGFCVLAALFVGLLPAWRASRPDLAADLAEKIEGGGARRGRWLARSDLPVLFEIALSMVLLVSAGLFLRGAFAASHLDPGFELDRQAVAEIDSSLLGYEEEQGKDLLARIEERLGRIPGVRSVGSAGIVPFGMVSLGKAVAPSEAGADPEDEQRVAAAYNVAGPGYFETMDIPLLRGRAFRESEGSEVAVIDEVLAHELWPDAEAIGRHLRILGDEQGELDEIEVVGVVASIRDSVFDSEPGGHLWLSNDRQYMSNAHLHLLFDTEPDAALLGQIRAAIREVDGKLPVLALRSMRDHLEASVELWVLRTGGRLFTVFAAVALLLTLAGVYGVRAYSVARRSREIGIRMALGSSVADTLRMVLREGFRLALAGSLLGLILAAGAARLLAGFLFEVSASDPLVFGASFLLLFTVAVGACLGPARRAARVDPLQALRTE
ncbi:MAG TPA: ABC transporter permease [Thermoanaerobaculia bacterium]|nr:ABC transporter permease [Thermoanaerobaculia bacterium]